MAYGGGRPAGERRDVSPPVTTYRGTVALAVPWCYDGRAQVVTGGLTSRRSPGYVAMMTVFTSVYSCSAYAPSSRPMPLILNPPNGAAASNTS